MSKLRVQVFSLTENPFGAVELQVFRKTCSLLLFFLIYATDLSTIISIFLTRFNFYYFFQNEKRKKSNNNEFTSF